MNEPYYEYELVVRFDDNEIGKISALSLESLEEQFHKIESIVKDCENKREAEAQAEFDRQQEEKTANEHD